MFLVQVGKEFPDMKQNERKIKFIKIGDAVRTAGQLNGELTLNEQWSLVRFYTHGSGSGLGVFRVICWLDEAHILGGGRRGSPCGLGGETGYTAQEDLKSLNNYNMGEGRTIRVGFFCSCIPRPFLVLSALLSLSHHIWY